MRDRPLYLEIFLLSLAVILLEVSYTRIFSFKLVYYFTYLIIGLAMLGLGTGGVLVAMLPGIRRHASSRTIPVCALIAGAAVLVGYLVVARVQLNALHLADSLLPVDLGVVVREGAKLVLVCGCLFTPFFAAGLAVAAIFATQPEAFSRLYFADLVGAGLACAAVIPLITLVSPPGVVFLGGFVASIAGLRLAALHARRLLLPLAVLAGVLLVGGIVPRVLPDPVPDGAKGIGRKGADPPKILLSRWSPVFRIDVVANPVNDDQYVLYHDALIGSVLNRFDGDLGTLGRFDRNHRAYPFRMLGPAPHVAIIGAAGGNEILASLHFGAAHVTAVELNPATVGLLTHDFADYSGHLAENDRVTLVNGEGRSFLRRDPSTYDLIWFVAPDSYAAMNAATSGAYVLSESYLYTREMIADSLAHLRDDGLVCAQFGEIDFDHKPNRTARYVATARAAFQALGIDDFGAHVLVATTDATPFTSSTILLRRRPFAAADVGRFTTALDAARGRLRFAPGRPEVAGEPIGQIVTLPAAALARWYDESPFDVRPVTDDAPFFWHFVGFRAALRHLRRTETGPHLEEGIGERLLLVFLLVATTFAAILVLAPIVARRAVWGTVPGKLAAATFFAAIGTGFMFLEVTLIQRLTLFLGYPTYSLTVTLFALLVATGIGSWLSERYGARRDRALRVLALVLVAVVLLYRFGLTPLTTRAAGLPFAARVPIAVGVLLPLGVCLGAFMPLGLRTVAALTPHREEFIAWSWGVNGFFSVVSSVLATVLAMAYGFDTVMLAALAAYLVGIAALLKLPAPDPRGAA